MAGEEHKLLVEVLTPEGQVFEGEVKQVSTRTTTGEIGILANHVPILAALEPTELRLHVSDSEIERYAQAHGWLQVYGNRARLLLEEARGSGRDGGAKQKGESGDEESGDGEGDGERDDDEAAE